MRFSEFQGEWVEKRLGKLVENVRERISTSSLSIDNYISTENILQNFQGVISATSTPNNTNVIAFRKDDVLFSNIRPYLKKIWLANDSGGCSADVFVFRSNDICKAKFLYHLIANDKFINYVMLGTKGTKMPRGDKQQINQYSVYIPSKSEQSKITTFLSLLDDRISTQIQIIEELELLMKGLILSFIRKKEKNTQLKDCLNCHSSTLMESAVIEKNGIYPVYGATGVIAHTSNYEIDKDAILIIKDGSGVGKVQYAKDKYSVIGTLNYLTPRENISLKFLYYYLQAFNFDKYKVGSGIPHIYFKDYGNEYIYCPPIEAQNKIANFLSAIDEKLETEKQILKKYIEQKKYLLANMFV